MKLVRHLVKTKDLFSIKQAGSTASHKY